MSSHASLGAAADERKARLAKLKSLKRKQPTDDEETLHVPIARSPTPPPSDVATLHLSGRNYDALSKGPKLGFEAPPTLVLQHPTLEQQAQAVEDQIKEKEREEAAQDEKDKGVDLFKLQPKKPNWDLKRDLGEKMKVLNVRTDNAIARMVREKIEATKQAKMVKLGGTTDEKEPLGIEGTTLVEGLKVREKEDEEEQRREREDDDL